MQCWPWTENITSDRRAVVQISLLRKLTKHSLIRLAWKRLSWTPGCLTFVPWMLWWGKVQKIFTVQCFPGNSSVFRSSNLWLRELEKACGGHGNRQKSHTSKGEVTTWQVLWRQQKFPEMWLTEMPSDWHVVINHHHVTYTTNVWWSNHLIGLNSISHQVLIQGYR